MIRLFLMFALLLGLAALAAFLAGNPGSVQLDIGSWRVDTTVAVLVAFLAIWSLLLAFLLSLWSLFRRDMPLFGSNRHIKRQTQGMTLVNKSLVALAAGDHRTARRLANQASLLIPHQPVLHMIQAEAALKSGDHDEARQHFSALEASDDGRLIGLRGLLADARRTGRGAEALRLARTAFEENPKSPWVLETLFSLEVANGNWADAARALDRVAKLKLLDLSEIASHRGALAYAEAAEASVRGDQVLARKGYASVLKYRPDFAPAILAQAQIETQAGNKSKAEKLIRKAWSKTPRATLARAYKGLDVAESRIDWIKRAEKLSSGNPDHPESLLLLGDAYLDAHQTERATPVISRLMETVKDRRAWSLRLREATQLGQDTDAIEEALEHAPLVPPWVCTSCGHAAQHWTPLCEACSGFDSFQPGEEYGDVVNIPRAQAALSAPLSVLAGEATTDVIARPVKPAPGYETSHTNYVSKAPEKRTKPDAEITGTYDPADDLWDD